MVFLLLFAARSVFAQGATSFVYPAPENPDDQRHTYYWELLDAALAANQDRFGPYHLSAYDAPMNYSRAIAEVETGKGRVNIVARATNLDLERRLLPISIPLDKGLLGFRIFMIRKESQAALSKVHKLDELKHFRQGMSPQWTDARIMAQLGFPLELQENYENLFRMLTAKRFDLLSRGINEVGAELKAHADAMPELVVEKDLLLHYPMPRYFFVPRTEAGRQMAHRIEDGLMRLRRSGEFERRYQAYKKAVLAGVHITGRRVFELGNPELSALAPLDDPYWWETLHAELKDTVGKSPAR
ncbi:hypothetical protein [Uliginosibacterium gangwonense]|uniref:hypothetical protein n=1 Tax=Uliginosibacterium gangwonense TaxID=392736 RepID=UPI0003668BEC|nr:hypothetical protein [Uliginosibacterium gangwonense]